MQTASLLLVGNRNSYQKSHLLTRLNCWLALPPSGRILTLPREQCDVEAVLLALRGAVARSARGTTIDDNWTVRESVPMMITFA